MVVMSISVYCRIRWHSAQRITPGPEARFHGRGAKSLNLESAWVDLLQNWKSEIQ